MATLSNRIKQLRQEVKLTQEEFGKLFGIVKSTVSLYESGKSTPDDELKKKIAKHFNVSLDYLMGLSNIRNPYKDNQEKHDEITTKAYHNLDVEGLPEEAIRQVEEYIEFIKQKYNPDGTLKKLVSWRIDLRILKVILTNLKIGLISWKMRLKETLFY